MKLSEAMRKGAKMGPQVYGKYGDGKGGTCGLGAIVAGALNTQVKAALPSLTQTFMQTLFPQLRAKTICPSCSGDGSSLAHVIIHLNDAHLWTRERIAGWIEAHIEVPTSSMLQMMEFMGEPVKEEVENVR